MGTSLVITALRKGKSLGMIEFHSLDMTHHTLEILDFGQGARLDLGRKHAIAARGGDDIVTELSPVLEASEIKKCQILNNS